MKEHPESKTPQFVRAIAVCGCGHDGRLGLGVGTSLGGTSTPTVTLIPTFVSSSLDDRVGPSAGEVLSVHCGGYHTIALTQTGLYGWGLNEDGQLGLGNAGASTGRAPVHTPTRLEFFDGRSWGTEKETVVRVSCGWAHSFVQTTHGLYATGRNEYGQLGLGHDKEVLEWQLVCSLPIRCKAWLDEGEDIGRLLAGDHELVSGSITHVSCGTHHTLLALENATLLRCEEDDTLLCQYPVLLLGAGKGDFGELGYNEDARQVLAAKGKRMQRALQEDVYRRHHFGLANAGSSGAPDEAANVPLTAMPRQWAPRKQRRPEFFSPHFKAVMFPLVESAVTTTHLQGSATSQVALAAKLDQLQCDSVCAPLAVEDLKAMHLHSAVTIRHLTPAVSDNHQVRTFHWGCYYCNEIEDHASSVPRQVSWEGVDLLLHAGDEVCFRYSQPLEPSSHGTIEVMGSGILGLGEDDSFEETWRALPLTVAVADPTTVRESDEMLSQRRVVSVTGMNHFLIGLADTAGSPSVLMKEVLGFGDNLHGQLGEGDGTDAVLCPRYVLREHDILHTPPGTVGHEVSWKVAGICSVGAGARHSVFVVNIYPCDT